MKELNLLKLPNNLFRSATEQDAEKASKIKVGKVLRGQWTERRNGKFFRKYWALLNYSFQCWEPGDNEAMKNIDQFRQKITILAGFSEIVYDLDGSEIIKAKSIAWGSMGEDEFEHLYSATINVILKNVLTNYTHEDLDQVVEQVLRFA